MWGGRVAGMHDLQRPSCRQKAFPSRIATLSSKIDNPSTCVAHTHLASGPYGYNPAAVPFDAALGAWASSLDPAPLLENATALADDAKSCGFTGAVMLHGLLNASCGRFTPRLLANAAPTYYGMMVAQFV